MVGSDLLLLRRLFSEDTQSQQVEAYEVYSELEHFHAK
jgi:hypothetical protein